MMQPDKFEDLHVSEESFSHIGLKANLDTNHYSVMCYDTQVIMLKPLYHYV